MREVGIHGKDVLVAHLQGIMEAREVGGAQTQLAWPVQHVNTSRKAPGEFLCYFTSPVWRVVIHNEYIKRPLLQDVRHQQFQIDGFIVRRNDDYVLSALDLSFHRSLFG